MAEEQPTAPVQAATPASIDTLSSYIQRAAGALLAVEPAELSLDSGILREFVSTEKESCVYLEGSLEGYELKKEVNVGSQKSVVIVIKGKGVVSAETPLQDQLFLSKMSLQEDTTSLVSYVVSKYLDVVTSGGDDGETAPVQASTASATAKRRINELILSFRGLQQAIEAPNLALTVHPEIVRLLQEHGGDEDAAAAAAPITDSSFLNSIQSIAGRWVSEIRQLASASYTLESSEEEVRFWRSKETALRSIEKQLEEPGIKVTLEILKQTNRFHRGFSFLSDSGIRDALTVASRYNQLLKDMPVSALGSAHDLESIAEALSGIYTHLKKLKVTQYPTERAVLLVQVIANETHNRVLDVVERMRVMELPYKEFVALYKGVTMLLDQSEGAIRRFVTMAREVLRKRSERFMVIKVDSPIELRERLGQLKKLRDEHTEFYSAVEKLSSSSKLRAGSLLAPIEAAYDLLNNASSLDLTSSGKRKFTATVKSYHEQIESIEGEIGTKLQGAVEEAQTPNAILAVLSDFDFLFRRPTIRNMVQEHYQERLVTLLQQEVQLLEQQFHRQVASRQVLFLRGIPAITAKIVWIQQVQEGVHCVCDKLELVLGADWRHYPEGMKIDAQLKIISQKLSTENFVREWIHETMDGIHFPVSAERVLMIDKVGAALRVKVNFMQATLQLPREVENLRQMGLEVPAGVVSYSKEIQFLRPHAISLLNAISCYHDALDGVDDLGELKVLLQPLMETPQKSISLLLRASWGDLTKARDLLESNITDVKEVQTYNAVGELATEMTSLAKKYDSLRKVRPQFVQLLQSLNEGSYGAFETPLTKLQGLVDKLATEGFAGIDRLIASLNRTVQSILAERCRAELVRIGGSLSETQHLSATSRHSLSFKNRQIGITPPLEDSKELWLGTINQAVQAVTAQKTLNSKLEKPGHFSAVLLLVEKEYRQCVSSCNALFDRVLQFTAQWRNLQYLWDIELDTLKERLGADLPLWVAAFEEGEHIRAFVDTIDTERQFGPLVVDYAKVQIRVNAQFDGLLQSMAASFAEVLSAEMRATDAEITQRRKLLEAVDVDFVSGSSVLALCSAIFRANEVCKHFTESIRLYRRSNTVLKEHKFQFPDGWVYFEQLSDNYQALRDLANDRLLSVKGQRSIVASRLSGQSQQLQKSFLDTGHGWEAFVNGIGENNINEVANQLAAYNKTYGELREQQQQLRECSTLLDLDISCDLDFAEVDRELGDLKEIWGYIYALTGKLDAIRRLPWTEFSPQTLKSLMDDILAASRTVPTKVRNYAAFVAVQDKISDTMHCAPLLSSLNSDCMQASHWTEIFEALTMRAPPSNFTVGHVLDLHPQQHDKMLKAVLQRARSEKLLADSLRAVQSSWEQTTFTLKSFHDQYSVVADWNALFDKLDEDLDTLSSMQASPFAASFKQEILNVESKLSFLHTLFDTWLEVQRNWIYLFGIFKKNSDIKSLLPIESARFDNVTSELFLALNAAYKTKSMLELSSVPGLTHTLEKVSQSLSRTKKALSGYLEKQREAFPRFYFVGNDDLLEIVGNASNVEVAARHVSRMFPGIASIVYQDDEITCVRSQEGELLPLVQTVSTKDQLASAWLSELDHTIKQSLHDLVPSALADLHTLWQSFQDLQKWVESYPCQILLVSLQLLWTELCEKSIRDKTPALQTLVDKYETLQRVLADSVLGEMTPIHRLKLENVISETLHQTQILRELQKGTSLLSFNWVSQQRYYFDADEKNIFHSLAVRQGTSLFYYGFEYLGSPLRLVYTPLVNHAFCSMAETLSQSLGASLFGPAGTGKTESVKMLGQNLGRMVLVFCCDERFDFYAVSRILVGVCRLGSWCCFDEFNRLDEKMLSAMSTQIENIESCLAADSESAEITLLGSSIRVNKNSGIFITSNPGYAGRSELPDNLKSKYRTFALAQPDTRVIAEVTLLSQGFASASYLAPRIVQIFSNLHIHCSPQKHYDFGLRALKATLLSCGRLKRGLVASLPQSTPEIESQIILKGLYDIVLPRLVPQDEAVFEKACTVLGKMDETITTSDGFAQIVQKVALDHSVALSDPWMRKCLQLHEIYRAHQGLILVGQSGVGKSTMLACFMEAVQRETGRDNLTYTFDPKVISKEEMYGWLDYATREWTDGVVTSIVRSVAENLRGEQTKNVWVVLDGDIDPLWVENLNSVLDDNHLLTLPNGERLAVPQNLKFVFEVDTLEYATPATVSRCGVVWFSSELFSLHGDFSRLLKRFKEEPLMDEETLDRRLAPSDRTVGDFRDQFAASLVDATLLKEIWDFVTCKSHVMPPEMHRSLATFFALLRQRLAEFVSFVSSNVSLAQGDHQAVVDASTLVALLWSFGGTMPLETRREFGSWLTSLHQFAKFKDSARDLVYVDSCFDGTADWVQFSDQVPTVSLEPQAIVKPDTVIPTLDTVRNEQLIFSLLEQHRNLVLSGPPGAGKTMLLMAALRKSPKFDFVGMNFSRETTPSLVLKCLEQHCVYKNGANGAVLQPVSNDKWMVVFCDEINLPKPDSYATQTVISYIRQLIVHNGFWRPRHRDWVSLQRIQFVGACNPPTDPGRTDLSARFLRHTTVLMVDYPGQESLMQIYETFNKALLKLVPDLRGYAKALTEAMLAVYTQFATKFDRRQRAHYICSPRELTRWVRGMFQSVSNMQDVTVETLVRLWAFEGLRLFADKLDSQDHKQWTFELVQGCAAKSFPYVDLKLALRRPILFSDWLSFDYRSVERPELAKFVAERLKVFGEEETNLSLALHGDMLEYILKIDRVLKNPQGHLILVGVNGSGKTILTRFVAWMNGLKVFMLTVSNDYTLEDFDNTLRELLIQSGVKGEKICFIIDESTILDTAFLERMNTLLANAEVPGLFEGDAFKSLMDNVASASQAAGLYLSSEEELYSWFVQQVSANFHVVFTMGNPYRANTPAIISSPALFNRCVLIWMGDWGSDTLVSVAAKYLERLPLDKSEKEDFRDCVIGSLVSAYLSVQKQGMATPLQFVALIQNFASLVVSREARLMEYHKHIQTGLDRLKETVFNVKQLSQNLQEKNSELQRKDEQAQKMLDKMLTEQNEAERKEEASLEIKKLLVSQEKKITQRRKAVYSQMAEVEPLIREAQKGVRNIKKQHLTEMRSMNNPPEAIKITLESVCIFLGFEVRSWRDVQSIIRKEDFIMRIIEYDAERSFSHEIAQYMNNHYMRNPIYNYESVYRASKACGPLLLWVQAQLRYAAILEQVEPLREEVGKVENSSLETKNKMIAIESLVSDLHKSIAESKIKYSQLIRDTESIKTQMSDVQAKVDYSTKLMESLKEERVRWRTSVGAFEQQRGNLIGNQVLVAAFMTFATAFNEKVRRTLWTDWTECLRKQGIGYDEMLTFASGVSTSSQVLQWEKHGLPNDDLFLENVAGLTAGVSHRYAFIVDPMSLMVGFLQKQAAPKKLVVASFLDKGYIRQLENCVRFGGSILILDAEHWDSAVSGIVSRETQTSGGRTLVRIGRKEVDLSPNFRLYLHTKDPSVRIPSFIASRMDVFNFTFTTASLTKFSLDMTLKSEKPELDAKRVEVIKANGEFKERLQVLEKDLLETLSSSKDSILENDALAQKLQQIKQESLSIRGKLDESRSVMDEIGKVTATFQVLGRLYSLFCLLVSHLSVLNPVYVFSNNWVVDVFGSVLLRAKGQPVQEIALLFTTTVYSHACISLLQQDRPIMATLCSAIYQDCIGVPLPPLSTIQSFAEAANAATVLIVRSSEGFDASVKIAALAKSLGSKFDTYSVGSSESTEVATRLLKDAAKHGRWVVIENVDMASELCSLLPKLLDALDIHPGFKVFLTCPVHARLPNILCKMATQVVFETAPGLKTILHDELLGGAVAVTENLSQPELALYFVLVWFYALLKERLRFVPIGFAKKYELNEYDLLFARAFIDRVLQTVSTADPVPWDFIQGFLGQIIIGGKIDVSADFLFVWQTARQLIGRPPNLLLTDKSVLSMPKLVPAAFAQFVQALPDLEPVEWLGLASDSDVALRKKEAKRVQECSQQLLETVRSAN